VSRAASEEMYRHLTRSYWTGEALSQLPPWVQAASKQGAVDRSRSEVVLVNAPSGDYVFAVITRNQRDTTYGAGNAGFELLRRVSALLWRTFEPAHPCHAGRRRRSVQAQLGGSVTAFAPPPAAAGAASAPARDAALPTAAELEAAAALVYAAMPPTPQYRWPLVEAAIGVETWVKHENHTPAGAFKVRGGIVYFDRLAREAADAGRRVPVW
jgi:hypothetical protein